MPMSFLGVPSAHSINVRQRGALGDNITEDTASIQACIDAAAALPYGGTVFLPAGRYITGQLRMKSRVALVGEGPSTILRAKTNLNASLLVLDTDTTNNTMLYNLWIDGNKVNQNGSGNYRGIEYINTFNGPNMISADLYGMSDAKHKADHVVVINCKGDGIYLDGRGECQFSNIRVFECARVGLRVPGQDNYFNNLTVGSSGLQCIELSGGANVLNNIKAWGAGIDASNTIGDGVTIAGSRNVINGLYCQENWRHGLHINGGFNNIVTGYMADASGSMRAEWGTGNASTVPSMGLKIDAGYNNMVDLTIGKMHSTAYTAYGLEIAGSSNFNVVRMHWDSSLTTAGDVLLTTGLLDNVVTVAGKRRGFDDYQLTETGTSWTLLDKHGEATVLTTASSAATVTLPNWLPVGFRCRVIQRGAGQLTFTPDTGATRVNRQSHTKSAAVNAVVSLEVVANSGGSAAVWLLSGDTAA